MTQSLPNRKHHTSSRILGDYCRILQVNLGWSETPESAHNPAMQHFDAIYQHVKRLARHELSKHAPMTLNTTALVHEAYVKLSEYGATVEDRQHLVNLVVRAMRQILIDSARRRASTKHGGDVAFQALEPDIPEPSAEFDAGAVTQAIDQIKQAHPRMGQVVEMHFLGGIEFNDIAELLGVDRKTIYRDWTAARVLLTAELTP